MTSFIEDSRWRPDLLKACISTLLLSNPVRLSLIETFRVKEKMSWLRVFFFFLHILKKYTPRKASFYYFFVFVFVFFFPNWKRPKGKKPRKERSWAGSAKCGRWEVWIPPPPPHLMPYGQFISTKCVTVSYKIQHLEMKGLFMPGRTLALMQSLFSLSLQLSISM